MTATLAVMLRDVRAEEEGGNCTGCVGQTLSSDLSQTRQSWKAEAKV